MEAARWKIDNATFNTYLTTITLPAMEILISVLNIHIQNPNLDL
jgi:hypothetical protein